jgi:hypothetical protein
MYPDHVRFLIPLRTHNGSLLVITKEDRVVLGFLFIRERRTREFEPNYPARFSYLPCIGHFTLACDVFGGADEE